MTFPAIRHPKTTVHLLRILNVIKWTPVEFPAVEYHRWNSSSFRQRPVTRSGFFHGLRYNLLFLSIARFLLLHFSFKVDAASVAVSASACQVRRSVRLSRSAIARCRPRIAVDPFPLILLMSGLIVCRAAVVACY